MYLPLQPAILPPLFWCFGCSGALLGVNNKGVEVRIALEGVPFLPAKPETILDTGIKYGKVQLMNTARKITVEVPEKLLELAQEASGEGITQTVRTGLRLVAASRTYARLRELRGKVKFSRTAADLKDDR